MVVGRGRLLERDAELARLFGLVDAVADGAFASAVIEGDAGAGKTGLLQALVARAAKRGIRLLKASGLELERGYPFGGVRQLLEPAVAELPMAARSEIFAGAAAVAEPLIDGRGEQVVGDEFALLNGLYWCLVGLSDLGPLAVVVDDVQWCDEESLRFLAFALKRGEELPLLVVAAKRDGADQSAALIAAFGGPSVVIRPPPLSIAAVAEILRESGRAEIDAEAAAEAERLTGGNPLYVRELADALRSAPGEARANPIQVLRQAAPAAIDRRVTRQLAGLEAPARALAEGVAVLGDEVPLRQASRLAELDPMEASRSADALVRDGLLVEGEPLRFRHPLVREAVLESVGARVRAALHARTARILMDEDGLPQRAVVHLLQSDPGGDRWVVETLRSAADAAARESAPGFAVQALRRAVLEPPDRSERPHVLKELAVAEASVGDTAAALGHFEEAFAKGSIGTLADAAGRYAVLLCGEKRLDDAEELIERVKAAVPERERQLMLEADLCTLTAVAGDAEARGHLVGRLMRVSESLDGETSAERLLLGLRAHETVGTMSADELVELVSRALGGGRLLAEQGPDSPVYLFMVGALQWADELEQAERELTVGLLEARRRGSALSVSITSGLLGVIARKRGRMLDAEAQTGMAVRVATEAGWLAAFPLPLAWLLPVLIDRGQLAQADGLLTSHGLDGSLPEGQAFTELLDARGTLRLAQGAADQGIADLEDFWARLEHEHDYRAGPWARLAKALVPVLVQADRGADAHELADRALSIAAAFGRPRFIAAGLRARALAQPGGTDLPGLEQAAGLYEEISAPLDRAQTLLDIGATLRRRRQPAAAREPLRRALDLARACGARPLADRVAHELRATGARPRRDRITGRDALTASEHRVAQLAIAGLTNREIAQSLFITRRTVDSHMEHMFRKLSIHSRDQLEDALADQQAAIGIT